MPRKAAEPTTTEAATVDASPNLALWNSVQTTDPRFTKSFSRSGGFRGTAISHHWQQKRATETFGPKGLGWGSKILAEEYAQGAPLVHDKHGVIGREIVHVVRIELWYVLDGKRGSVEAFGQTTFVGSNKHGTFTDEEAPKKSLTDAEAKALASLGFSADVHMGMFDDVKYVNDLKASIAEAEKPKGPTLEELMAKIEAATTVDELKPVSVAAASLPEADRDKLRPAYGKKFAALKGST
jgi:hypothetical protein